MGVASVNRGSKTFRFRVLPVFLILVVASRAHADDGSSGHRWVGTDVVVKDLFFQPRIGTTRMNSAVWEHRFHVAQSQGPWLWVTSSGTRGWVHQDEVVPLPAAISFFSAVILSHPYSAHAYYLRGLVWAEQNEPDIAIADFTAAIARDPNNAWAFHNRGLVYSEKSEHKKAIADYSEAIRLNSLDAAAYNNRGLAHDQRGDFERAIADYSEAIRHDPHLINAYYNRAGVLAETGENRRALVEYDYVVRHAPYDADARAHLAWLLATSADPLVRDPRRALEEAGIANELSGGKVATHLEALAAAQAAAGQWDEAVEWQTKALELVPQDRPERERSERRLKSYQAKQPVRE